MPSFFGAGLFGSLFAVMPKHLASENEEAQQSAAASQELSAQSQTLQKLVSRFTFPSAESAQTMPPLEE